MPTNPVMPLDPAAPRGPATGKRPKTGGRKKGTPNKSTAAFREAVLQVFADLQAGTGREHGHFLNWARGNPSRFYMLASRLLPRPLPTPEGRPPMTAMANNIAASNGQILDRASDQVGVPDEGPGAASIEALIVDWLDKDRKK